MDNREIDRQIAELMGWRRVMDYYIKVGSRKFGKRNDWQPSTNIAHAFEVRDKIATMSTSVRIRFARSLVDVISDRVEKRISPEMVMLYVEPVDISLAAIEAVKGKENG